MRKPILSVDPVSSHKYQIFKMLVSSAKSVIFQPAIWQQMAHGLRKEACIAAEANGRNRRFQQNLECHISWGTYGRNDMFMKEIKKQTSAS